MASKRQLNGISNLVGRQNETEKLGYPFKSKHPFERFERFEK